MTLVSEKPQHPSTLLDLTRYFLRLGTVGFGGPIALAAYMEEDLVEDRRWISPTDYKQGLALSGAYVQFGRLRWMQALFYGIAAAVIGIILRSAYKLTKRTLGNDTVEVVDLSTGDRLSTMNSDQASVDV